MTRQQPWSERAEREVLGGMLLNRQAADRAFELLTAADFYSHRHATVFAAAEQVHHRGQPIETATLTEALRRQDHDAALFLAELIDGAPIVGSIAASARIVLELATARRAITFAAEIAEAGYGSDLETIRGLLAGAGERLDAPIEQVVAKEASQLVADTTLEQRPWAVQGLLRVRDRLGVSGPEGHGKSMLLRQFAVCTASGLSPFTLEACTAHPALIVDLQEDEDELGEQLRRIIAQAGTAYQKCLYAVSRTEGINLLGRSDRQWLEGLIRSHRPALLVIGPLRKTYRADRYEKSSEEAADELTRILDDLRVGYDMAVAIEGHAGHDRGESWRFRGSSVFLDWFNFGFGLDPVKGERAVAQRRSALKRWRGDRPPGRPWPRQLVAGRSMPWEDAHQPPLEAGTIAQAF